MGGLALNILSPTPTNVKLCAEAILRGELVGMPTETVYGLAANALDAAAVRRVFEAKGRPANHPLIVHLSSIEMGKELVADWSEKASKLAAAFWPGPLTLILPKSRLVADEVTGGHSTVALRIPAHPVARSLIEEANVPLCAPSANPFMAVSPTRAEDIDNTFTTKLFGVLDGGPCEIGIESTVISVVDTPTVLRPGRITSVEISSILGFPVSEAEDAAKSASPGSHERHYSPRAQVRIVDALEGRTGISASGADVASYARNLYRLLHELDSSGIEVIYIEAPPRDPEWRAVWDRLNRASR